MKLSKTFFMMDSITLIFHKNKFIMFTLLFLWCRLTNVKCNTIHKMQVDYNNLNKDIEKNSILNHNRQGNIFDENVPKFGTNSLKIISKLLSLNDDKSKIQEIDSFKTNIKDDKSHLQNFVSTEGLKILKKFLLKYVKMTLSNSFAELLAGRRVETTSTDHNTKSFNIFKKQLYQFVAESESRSVDKPRAMETGRLFLYKGLKNLLWPLFIGVQIAKSILVALFLPSILGSLGIMVAKKLPSISLYKPLPNPIGDSDFPDTAFPLDDQYKNPRPEASEQHVYRQPFQPLMANLQNDNHLSNLVDQKFSYGDTGFKNTFEKNKNMFESFLKVPSSSLLLSNYDPFYSPLLSRIDSVFAQFKIEKDKEDCRSKLICFMYANPSKYTPYSNLVSAQLSRDLSELKKPINDNPDILRFFKYMQAGKGGQDGSDCDELYKSCSDLKDSETPVMIAAYNDINKLVQARKFIR